MSNVGWPGGDASVMANAIANSKPSIDEFVTRVLRGNVGAALSQLELTIGDWRANET